MSNEPQLLYKTLGSYLSFFNGDNSIRNSQILHNKLNMESMKRQGRYELDRSKNKEFFWRFVKNGREIARSSETYKRKAAARRSIQIIAQSGDCIVLDLTLTHR